MLSVLCDGVSQANERGISELHSMIDQFTLPVVEA